MLLLITIFRHFPARGLVAERSTAAIRARTCRGAPQTACESLVGNRRRNTPRPAPQSRALPRSKSRRVSSPPPRNRGPVCGRRLGFFFWGGEISFFFSVWGVQWSL